MRIREEVPSDRDQIRALLDRAFGGTEESLLVERLRAEGAVMAALVATENARVLGHILVSRLPIERGSETLRGAALAPLAVLPECQRRGIGTALVHAGLEACRARGVAAVVVLGDPDYYPRFGFSAATAQNLRAPFRGPAFMALELAPGCLGGMAGTVRYAEAFGLDGGSAAG